MVRKALTRWGRAVLPSLFLLFFLSECGIPSNPYLFPPKFKKLSQEGETTFEFFNDRQNSAFFLEGYEIYYKFYADDDTGYDTDKTQIEAISNEDLTLSTLENLQFHRFYQNTVNPGVFIKPLIAFDSATWTVIGTLADPAVTDPPEDLLITIDFTLDGATQPFPLITFASSSLEAGRYITVDGAIEETLESFLPADFQNTKTYSDVSAAILSEPFFNIGVVVYAYGVDDTLSQLYSLPLHLGKIRLSTL